jgi:pilus assembly protein CpaE
MEQSLRTAIVAPDQELAQYLYRVLSDTSGLSIVRTVAEYPNPIDLARMLRAHAPQVVFLSVISPGDATTVAAQIEQIMPGVQVVAFGVSCDPSTLMEIMRAGIREYIAAPFEYTCLKDCLRRVNENLSRKPISSSATDLLYSFLPAKPGVGTTTLAVNAAIAAVRQRKAEGLLMDFDLNCGMVRFLLRLENDYSILDAAEHSANMDEALWPQIVTRREGLDVVSAGAPNPDIRIEHVQISHLLDYSRRNYKFICAHFSGNLEKYSLEIMHESRRIFLVCTTEVASLHLAKEKLAYLRRMDLGGRVQVLLNRYVKRAGITPEDVEQIVGAPVTMTFPNDYTRVSRSIQAGKSVDPESELGRSVGRFAEQLVDNDSERSATAVKRRFVEYFNITPARFSLERGKSGGPVM